MIAEGLGLVTVAGWCGVLRGYGGMWAITWNRMMLGTRPNYFYGSHCMILIVTWKLEPLWEKGKSVAYPYIDLFFLQITHFFISHIYIKQFKQPNTKIQVRG